MDIDDDQSREVGLAGDRTGPQDELFDQIRHPVRRCILSELAAAQAGDELTATYLASGSGSPDSDPIELHHVHLPKLAAAGYVEWDRRSDTVTRGPRFASVEPAVELLVGASDRLPGAWF